jgi:selenocysteine lyase/cysteine desulfurase
MEAREGIKVQIAHPQGWFMQSGDLIAALTPRTRLISVSHVRFDDGSILDASSLATACKRNGTLLVLNATPTLIHDHNQALISYLFEQLPDGYRLASPRQASHRGVFGCIEVGSRSNTESLYQTLRDERFVVALREGRIRVAPHLLNSTQDMDRLLVSLTKARKGATHVNH